MSYNLEAETMVGYRFHPTDEELVNHYLHLKIFGHDHLVYEIAEVNLCEVEPWDLPGLSMVKSNDPVWYFFCPRNYKYRNSQRASRTTRDGYWKATGKDRIVKNETTNKDIAKKKTLVFYKGRYPRGVKTNWVLHEYNPTFSPPDNTQQSPFVICKLKRNKKNRMPATEEAELSPLSSIVDPENRSPPTLEEIKISSPKMSPEFDYTAQETDAQSSPLIIGDYENHSPHETIDNDPTFVQGEIGYAAACAVSPGFNPYNTEVEEDDIENMAREYFGGCNFDFALQSQLKTLEELL